MHQNQIFHLTRLRLTTLYVGVMGGILSLCGFSFYEMMAHAHWEALHRELGSIAGTLHDSLEPTLQHPGQIDPRVPQMIPGLCLTRDRCAEIDQITHRHILGTVQQQGYYARFLTRSGQMVARVGQLPEGLAFQPGDEIWQTVQDRDGSRYHQISVLLKTTHAQPWGYLQVGRSLQELDEHLTSIRTVFLIGLPVTMMLVTGASWWLAGLAMRPVYYSYRQIQQFTADAAHELRTPLAATRATVESALELDTLPESEARGVLQTVERQTIRLSQLVQDLLLLSRMDLQVLPHKQQSCNLKTLICDVVDEFEALAIAHQITLTTHLPSQEPLAVPGDEEQLYRLLANLVTNAIQYTAAGGHVTMTLTQEEHQALVQVHDTGVGIPVQEHPHIFDRFYRVHSDRSRHTGGAGLGLAIAHAIVQAHQGTIQVQSELGKGSVFSVRLPLKIHLKPI